MSCVQFLAIADDCILVVALSSIGLIVFICKCRLKVCNVVQGLCHPGEMENTQGFFKIKKYLLFSFIHLLLLH